MAVASLAEIDDAPDPDLRVEIPEQVGGRAGKQLAFQNNNPANIEFVGQPGAEKSEVSNAATALGVKPDTPVGQIDRQKLAEFQIHQESQSKLKRQASLADVEEPASAKPTASLAEIDAPKPAGTIAERAKGLLDQIRGVGSDISAAAQRPVAGLPEHLGEKVIGPWRDAATGLVHEATAPLDNVPGGKFLRDTLTAAIQKGGDAAVGALEFLTTPLGIATAPAAAGEGLVGGAVRSAFAGSQVPQAASDIATAVRNPTPENVAGAVVSTAGAALPMAREIGTEAAHAAGGIERHNATAAAALENERASGETAQAKLDVESAKAGTEPAAETVPVRIGDRELTVRASGQTQNGRPFYQVLDDQGKPVFAGFGENVQGYLRQQGAAPYQGGSQLPLRSDFTFGGQDYYVRKVGPGKLSVVDSTTDKSVFLGNQKQLTEFIVDKRATPTREFEPGTDAADAQPKAAEAAIPKEGTPENVARAVDARERLAQQLTGKSFKDLSNPERLVVDHFVSEGYGFAVGPKEGNVASLADIEEPTSPQAPQPVQAAAPANGSANETLAQAPTAPLTASLADITEETGEPLMKAGTEAPESVIPETIPQQRDVAPYPPLKPLRPVEEEAASAAAQPAGPGIYRGGERIAEIPAQPQLAETPTARDRDSSAPITATITATVPAERKPTVAPAVGRNVSIAVPGAKTSYPARYAVMEASDVQTSHNPQSFEPNPAYHHQNDRDYSQVENAARVVDAAQDFRPEFVLTESPTAEHGPTIVDSNGNALGGNNRAMALKRVYESGNPEAAAEYRQELANAAQRFGIDPAEVARFKQPVLVRQVEAPMAGKAAATAITDFNKTATASLNPAEQAVADGRRLSVAALKTITGSLDDLGDEGTLSQALRGDNGVEILNRLIKDGVITEQEKNGYLDERQQLTPEIKDRVAKALVGRFFATPKDMQQTPPELRQKVERIAPQVLRVEDREGWSLTEPLKDAIALLSEARAHGTKNLSDLTRQTAIGGTREYSPQAINIAQKLKDGPTAAVRAFRAYANDEAMSRQGAQTTLYEPPSQSEAFNSAFGIAETKKAKRGTTAGPPVSEQRETENIRLYRGEPSEPAPRAFSKAAPEVNDTSDFGRWFTPDLNDAQFYGGAIKYLDVPRSEYERLLAEEEEVQRMAPGSNPMRGQGVLVTATDALRAKKYEGSAKLRQLGEDTSGSAKLTTLTLGLDKFVEQDIAPSLATAARTIAEAGDDIVKILLPVAHGGDRTKLAALILRNRLAELARDSDRAEAALAVARKFFEKAGDKAGRKFILDYFSDENVPLPTLGNAELDGIARVLRNLLDGRRDEVQALGKGKLAKYYTNYFPRIWKDWRKAEGIMASFYGRRPLEGGKSFLKQRKHPTIQSALDAGLEPVTWNPIDLVLLKIREMDRYAMAHRVLEAWKEAGLAQFIDARAGKAPGGWEKIQDQIGTVYGPSIQNITEYPNAGLWSGLTQVADALGITHERGFKPLNRGNAIGLAHQGKSKVSTMHGTAEDVLAHEIGHQIDWLAGSGHRFVLNYPSVESVRRIRDARRTLAESGDKAARAEANKTLRAMKPDIAQRKEFAKQLRALADLRSGRKEYTHKREEKMALLAEMWVGARELFQKTAPLVFQEWKTFLDETPKLKALADIEGNTEVTAIAQPYDVGGLVIRGHYYAPAGAARILNNYLSPSLRTTSGAYKVIVGANNVLNQFQLGLSAFHLGFTSADAAISKAALGFEAALRGRPVAAVKAFAGVPFAPFTTMIQGNKLLREWYKPGSEGAWIAQLVDGLVAAGGRARMADIYGTAIADRMRHAFRNGNVWGGLLRAPFAGVEMVSDLMMKQIVPRQKLGVFADMARFELERLGPGATFEETRAALAAAWDSVENRMGQMTYDNLFWNRTAKDLAMLSVRSVGWNLGTLREVGGGATDLVRIPLQLAGGKSPKDLNIHRVAYLLGLVTVSAIMGALYQYLRTGKGPEEPKDYFFPKTGQLDEAGRPQRASLPTYVKDIYHYFTEPGKTLANKVAPIWSVFGEMARNEDFYGTEIRNVDDPLVDQMKQAAEYAGRSMEPFGVRNIERDRQMQNPVADQIARGIGITPAPSAIEKTKAERLASELAQARIPSGGRTHGEASRRDAEQSIARLAKAGKDYADQARDYIASGVLSSKDVHAAALRSQVSPLLRTSRSLPLEDLLRVWKAATPAERDELRPLLKRHMSSAKELPPAQRATLIPKLEQALTQ